MGTATGVYSARTNHRLRIETQLASQNIAGNYSTINFQIYSEKTAASTSYYLTAGGGGSYNIGGNTGSLPAWLYDFRSATTYTRATGSVNVGHNSDGTLTYSFSASDTAPGSLGSASASGSETLPTIARATQPTVSPGSGPTASTFTIGHSAASGSFYHDVFYSLDGGGSYSNIAVDVPASTTSTAWTPAHSLLPNSTSNNVVILLRTKASAGGTIIGDKLVGLSIYVPSSIVPTISNVTWADTQIAAPDIPTIMGGGGRYVQGWSKLQPTIASAGAGGSTVTSSSVTQNGQVTASGTAFGTAVGLSGAVPFTAVAVDSRNASSAVFSSTVAVTAYNFPNLPTPVITRTSDAAGNVPSPTGTYLSITPSASVSNLLFGGVEKNLLEWQIRIKPTGGTYTTISAWNSATVSGNTWTTKSVASGYASSTEYVVEVSVRDFFGKNGYNTGSTVKTLTITVPTESVFMDWDGNNGLGLGKYRTSGMLDVFGQMYQNNGQQVMDQGNADSLLPGRLRPTNNLGLAPNPDTLTSSGWYSGYNWAGSLSGYSVGTLQVIQYSVDWITQVFILAGPSPVTLTRVRHSGTTWSPWRRTIQDDEGGLAEKLPLGSGWFWYHDIQSVSDPNTIYSPPFAYRSSTGFVQVHGLLYNANSPAAAGAVMLNLPAAYRPLQRWRGLVWASGNQMGVIVETNGDVKIEYALTGGGLVSLSGIKFNNDAGIARTAMTLQGAWVAMGAGEGTPRYALDGSGRVLLEGCIKNGVSSSDVWVSPGGYNPNLGGGALVHSWEQASANRLARFDIPASPVAAPYPLHSQVTASGTVTSTGRSLDLDYVRDGWGFNAAGMMSAWVNYGSGWNTAGYTRLADGAGKAKGLIANGAMGTAALQMPLSYAPKYRLLFYADCADAPGRVDIDPTGTVYPMTGANSFVSLEGLEWVPKNFTP